MSRWCPIATAPKNNKPVLLWFPNERMSGGDHVVMARWDAKHDGWRWRTHAAWGSAVRGVATHWMPLPPGPSLLTRWRPSLAPFFGGLNTDEEEAVRKERER